MPLSGISISLRASIAYKCNRHLDTISSLCDCSISTMNWGVGPGEMDDWKSETVQDSSHVQNKFCLPSSGFGSVFVCLLVLLFFGVWGLFLFCFLFVWFRFLPVWSRNTPIFTQGLLARVCLRETRCEGPDERAGTELKKRLCFNVKRENYGMGNLP